MIMGTECNGIETGLTEGSERKVGGRRRDDPELG